MATRQTGQEADVGDEATAEPASQRLHGIGGEGGGEGGVGGGGAEGGEGGSNSPLTQGTLMYTSKSRQLSSESSVPHSTSASHHEPIRGSEEYSSGLSSQLAALPSEPHDLAQVPRRQLVGRDGLAGGVLAARLGLRNPLAPLAGARLQLVKAGRAGQLQA